MVVDPGRPFSRSFQSLIEGLEDQLKYGVEQPDLASYVFKTDVARYTLPRPAEAITRVTGLVGSKLIVFEPGYDYTLNAATNQLVWVLDPPPSATAAPRNRPPNDARFEVEFVYREFPAGITDFNPGSVMGALVRAIAREMKLMFDQVDEAYRRAFIDHAEGAALDNVVALLGVHRNPATPATGFVTFFSDRALNDRVLIRQGTIVADRSGRRYRTDADGDIPLVLPDRLYRQVNGVITVENRIADVLGIWLDSVTPADDNGLATVDVAPKQPFGVDGKTIKLANPTGLTPEVRVRYKPRSVTVAVTAVAPGPEGNLSTAAIEVMPTPPGPVKVTNEAELRGGQLPEPDDQLRERAKNQLERAGRATLNAIKYAVLDVDGVEAVEVRDHSVEGAIPLGEVRLSYDGENVAESRVLAAIEDTRAAGILVTLSKLRTVFIAGTIYVLPAGNATPAAVAAYRDEVIKSIAALGAGESLAVRRLTALVFGITGLADVAEAQLEARPEVADPTAPPPAASPIGGTYLTARGERVKPDASNLLVVLLRSLSAVPRPGSPANEIQLSLRDAGDNEVRFTSLDLDVTVVLRARLLNQPDQAPEQVRSALVQIHLRNQTRITVNVVTQGTGSLGFRPAGPSEPNPHDPSNVEVIVTAAAYPSLETARTTVNLAVP